jgi:hypothetical protein
MAAVTSTTTKSIFAVRIIRRWPVHDWSAPPDEEIDGAGTGVGAGILMPGAGISLTTTGGAGVGIAIVEPGAGAGIGAGIGPDSLDFAQATVPNRRITNSKPIINLFI